MEAGSISAAAPEGGPRHRGLFLGGAALGLLLLAASAAIAPREPGAARLARGLAAAVLAGGAAAYYLLGHAAPGLERSLAGAPDDDAPSAAETTPARLAAWILGLRWIAVVGAAAAIDVATLGLGRVPASAALPLWAGVVALGAFNALLGAIGAARLTSAAAFTTQIAADVAALAWLVHQAGGVENPFAVFFVVPAAVACVALERGRARLVTGSIAAFVAALTLAEGLGLAPPGCLVDRAGVCAGVDRVVHLGTGTALVLMIAGTSPILISVVATLRAERARLARASEVLREGTRDVAAARAQAQAEREKLQAIIDCMADAVVYVAPDGRVLLRNAAAARLWAGGAPQPASDLRACHAPEAWERVLAKVVRPAPVEIHPVIQVGDRSYEASYAPVRERGGELAGVVMVARDVTERIEAQRWLMQEERMAVVGKLAAGLAHELNNPLGAIVLFTQHALGEVPPSAPLAEHLGTVLRNARLCTRILRDLLEYARRRPPERGDVRIGELLGDTVRTLEPHAAAAGVTVCAPSAEGCGEAVVFGDPDQLQQVLVNLGLNAIEAMPDGGTLTLEAAPGAHGAWEIRVRDTGAGIEAAELERIFGAFHTTKPEGTGLGLTVARDIVTAHGGRLTVESRPGAGSTFQVTLPPRAAARPAEPAP